MTAHSHVRFKFRCLDNRSALKLKPHQKQTYLFRARSFIAKHGVLLVVTLRSEVLPSNLQLYTSSFVLTCRFYKVFGRCLFCCVRIGLDWIQILGHQLDWTGLGSVARGFGLDWIVSTQSIPYSAPGSGTDPLWPMMDTARSGMGPTRSEKMGLSVRRRHDLGIGSIFLSIF